MNASRKHQGRVAVTKIMESDSRKAARFCDPSEGLGEASWVPQTPVSPFDHKIEVFPVASPQEATLGLFLAVPLENSDREGRETDRSARSFGLGRFEDEPIRCRLEGLRYADDTLVEVH